MEPRETGWGRTLDPRFSRGAAIALCAVFGTLLPAGLGAIKGYPEARVHDEFCYLLAADTFAHGRLTNPSPPLPEFFEAPHILVSPTYGSKYPPAQGLALAIGQVVFGHPIWGVWLSCGAFAACLCWMLQSWTSKQWALATTLLAIVSVGGLSRWAQSYWGGMIAACGGALLFGGMRRTIRLPRIGASLWMAFGVVLLANSRPFEGLLACTPVGLVLCAWLFRRRDVSLSRKLVHWALPFAGVLVAGGTAMAAYNQAVTGDWRRMPYSIHQRQYLHQDLFLFSPPREPMLHPVPRIARFYDHYRQPPRSAFGAMAQAAENLYVRLPATIQTGLGEVWLERPLPSRHAITLWVVALCLSSLARRWASFCIATVVLVCIGNCFVWAWHPHYIAPIVPLVLALVADALRRNGLSHIAGRRRSWSSPRALIVLAALYGAAVNGVPAVGHWIKRPESKSGEPAVGSVASPQDVVRILERRPESHLVFVHYDDDYDIHDEWVYNAADLSTAGVIFAHDLGSEKNRRLIALYPDRSVWMVEVSNDRKTLNRYSDARGSPDDELRRATPEDREATE